MRLLLTMAAALTTAVHATSQNTQASYTNYGSGCPGSNGVPATSSPSTPIFGSSFAIHLDNGRPNSIASLMLGDASLNVPLDLIGATGCTLLVAPFTTLPSLPTDALGHAEWETTIPNDPTLMGFALYHQWIVADPANPFPISLSDGGVATIGVSPQVQVSSVTGPTSGSIGTMVTIVGQNFGDDPLAFCIRGEDANGGSVLFLGRGIVHRLDGFDELQAELVAAPVSPLPTQIHMLRGRNRKVPAAPAPGVSAAEESWAWDGHVYPEHMTSVFMFTPVRPRGTGDQVYVIQRPAGENYYEFRFPALDPWSGATSWSKGITMSANFDWRMTCTSPARQYDGWFQAKKVNGSLSGLEIGQALAAHLATSFNARFASDEDITTEVTLDGSDVVVKVHPPLNCTLSASASYGKLTISPPPAPAAQVIGLSTVISFTSQLEAVDSAIGATTSLSTGGTDVVATADGTIVAVASFGNPVVVETWSWGASPSVRGSVTLPLGFTNVDLEMVKGFGAGDRFALAVSRNADTRVLSIDVVANPPVIIDTLTLSTPVDLLAISPNGQFVVAAQFLISPVVPRLTKFLFGVDPLNPGCFAAGAPEPHDVFNFAADRAYSLEFNPTGEQLLCGLDDGSLFAYNVAPVSTGTFDLSQRSVILTPPLPGTTPRVIQFRRDCTQAYVLYHDAIGFNRKLVEFDVNVDNTFATTLSGQSLVIGGFFLSPTMPMGAVDGGDAMIIGVGGNYHRVATGSMTLASTIAAPAGGSITAIDVLGI